jgi:CO/xanthine dehydrogenase FAD-binding subunit
VDGGKLGQPRVALGSISPVPHQVQAAHQFLDGKTLDDATAAKTADMILKGAKPLEHNGYKVPMAHALIRRTLLKLKDETSRCIRTPASPAELVSKIKAASLLSIHNANRDPA